MPEILGDEEKANWHPGEEGRLTKDEAHDAANAMRGEMGVRPYRNSTIEDKQREPQTFGESMEKMHHGDIGRKPTKQDYEEAFRIIDELKQAAASESDFQKNASKILRGVNRVVQELLAFGGVVGTMGVADGRGILKSREEGIKNNFQDAEKKLRDKMKQGEEFGEKDIYHGKTTEDLKKSKAA